MISYVSSIFFLFRYGSVDIASYNTVLALPKRPFSSTRDSKLFVSTMANNLPCIVNLDQEKNYEPRNIDLVRIIILCLFFPSRILECEN